jgi:hypothetical protein
MALLAKEIQSGMVEEAECFVNGKGAGSGIHVRENLKAVLELFSSYYSSQVGVSTRTDLELVREVNWSAASRSCGGCVPVFYGE